MIASQTIATPIIRRLASATVIAIAISITGCKPPAAETLQTSDTSEFASVAESESASVETAPLEVEPSSDAKALKESSGSKEANQTAELTCRTEAAASDPKEPPAETEVVSAEASPKEDEGEHDPEIASPNQPDLPVDKSWKALTDTGLVWIDPRSHSVIASGKVCMREGPLEMFACPPNTKEYESVVVVNCPAFMIHGALLAVGAEPGSPVKFDPYKGATGPVIDIYVEWLEEDGTKRRERAQEWIRHNKTGKPMEFDFVFGGSGFWTHEDTGQQNYFAEGGELICVSNFSTATIDLPVESPQDNQGLWFTAFTDKIPKLETKIHLILVPRLEGKAPSP